MKIVFLMTGMGSGGAERTVAYLTKYLSKKGYEVTLLIISDLLFYEIDPSVRVEMLDIPSQPQNMMERITSILKRFVKVRKEIKNLNPDIVFCILPEAIKYLYGMKRRYHFKIVSSERNLPQADSDKEMKQKLKQFDECDGLIFQTQRALDFYPEKYKRKGIVIENAVGNELAYRTYQRNNIRKVISAVGRLAEQKDYPTLISAFEIVSNKHQEYILEIYGDGAQKEELEQLVKQEKLVDKVVFCGARKDALSCISDTSCYVMSSKYEGMPNALMEAMAIGLPVISTDCPNGPAELITNYENGVLVPVGDVEKLAQEINYLIENPEVARKLGDNARNILKTNNVNRIVQEYTKYLEHILK